MAFNQLLYIEVHSIANAAPFLLLSTFSTPNQKRDKISQFNHQILLPLLLNNHQRCLPLLLNNSWRCPPLLWILSTGNAWRCPLRPPAPPTISLRSTVIFEFNSPPSGQESSLLLALSSSHLSSISFPTTMCLPIKMNLLLAFVPEASPQSEAVCLLAPTVAKAQKLRPHHCQLPLALPLVTMVNCQERRCRLAIPLLPTYTTQPE